MPYKYLVQCWIHPRSGFDVAKKSRIMELFRSIMKETFSDDARVDTTIEKFNRTHEGLVLEPFIVESDIKINDPEKEILPEIQKTHPEATVFSCGLMPEIISSKR